jgi:hypothetical protein
MSSADLDVASYLAQRKAKKSISKNGGGKFKTFTATSVFMAAEAATHQQQGGEDGSDEVVHAAAMNGNDGVVAGQQQQQQAWQNHHHTSPSQGNHPTASTLVSGEWIDDESQYSDQPRLVTGGVQVVDLQSLDLDGRRNADEPKKFLPGKHEASEGVWGAPDIRRSEKKTSEQPTSVWAKVDRDIVRLKEEEKQKAEEMSSKQSPTAAASGFAKETKAEPAAEAKPNVWRPKSQMTAATPPSASSPTAQAPSSQKAPAAQPPNESARNAPTTAAAPSGPTKHGATFTDGDGLKRTANAWKPRRGNE